MSDSVTPRGAAWSDLISAIALLSKHALDEVSPFHCEHDSLTVLSDASKFTERELAQLSEWGFIPPDEDEEGFLSFRYGSA